MKSTESKVDMYVRLQDLLSALLEGESDFIANLANTSALLFEHLPTVNWAGFYLLKNHELVLGPFQGKTACTRIPVGRGVCGNAAAKLSTLIVPDVHKFPGHIACDIRSRSEIVIPFFEAQTGEEEKNEAETHQKKLLGVLDVDSPLVNRFDTEDKQGLETFIDVLQNAFE